MLERQTSRTNRWPRPVTLGLTVQIGLVVAAIAVGGLADPVVGYSILAGALASAIPTAWWAARVFGRRGNRRHNGGEGSGETLTSARVAEEVGSMYRAEIAKLLGMMALLVLALAVVRPLNAGALVGGFLAAYLAFVVIMSCANLNSGSES